MTAIEPQTTKPRRTTGAAPLAARWRSSTHPAPRPTRKTVAGDCPVAALAREAADALRLMEDLRDGTGDRALLDALAAPLDCTQPEEMRDALWDRLKAIIDLASHRRAQSLKGAAFQIYLAAHEGRHAHDEMQAPAATADKRLLEETDRKVSRLQYGALAYLEEVALDDDLKILRDWYQSPLYDIRRYCDGAVQTRDLLIAEVRALPTATS